MKKLFFLVLILSTSPAFADGEPADGYPPASVLSRPAPQTNYLNPDRPLSPAEKQAAALADKWTKQTSPGAMLADRGKVVFVHGANLPTIIAAPLNVCDVELQPGEKVNEVVVGDSARWMVETGISGPDETVHLFIKPVDAGLESSVVVTTDRRAYHLRLVSRREGHMPYAGFLYSDDLNRQATAKRQTEDKKQKWESTLDAEGKPADLSTLNFAYSVKGKASWMPERVFDDGLQTFIRLPESAARREMPVLLVRKGNKDVLVNYRVKNNTMVVDGLFERIALVLGVGSDQEKVEVVRGK